MFNQKRKKVIMLYRAKTLSSYKLKGKEGKIGSVEEFYFDDKFWTVRYLVADTGNWFVGKQVLITPYLLTEVDEEESIIRVNLTEEEVENFPTLDSDKPVSRQFEESYYNYFRLPAYWNGRHMWGAWPYIMREQQEAIVDAKVEESWDPHLRSTKSVTNYGIHAKDGEIGHVEDFVIDEESWAIRYFIIDTKNWWGGKKVLISPHWIDRISWDELKVYVNLSQESIKQSPEYSEELPVTREYEELLHRHYTQKGYWVDE